ncbi:MAG: twin arginine-targeting protein translocase TatB [Proteobacteria bacterium SG_bin9]|nr:MAG: twin arginine-targeting protein translocase TatB [Proteobacteria bacterium SG_bin9]
MFDIGWSELVLIGVVALIVLGPKELPGVLRMVGQWVGKARRMAADFQGQFQEAMREAEMADVKKSFDDVKNAAHDFTGGNLLTNAQQQVEEAIKLDTSRTETPPATPAPEARPAAATSATPATETMPAPEVKTEAKTEAKAS